MTPLPTHISIPLNCPLCKKFVVHSKNLVDQSCTILEAVENQLVIHPCLLKKGHNFWQWKLLKLASAVDFGHLELLEKIKFKPSKLQIKKPNFGIIEQIESDGEITNIQLIGLDGRHFEVIYNQVYHSQPYQLVQLIKPVKTSGNYYRVQGIQAPVFPSFNPPAEKHKDYYQFTFQSNDINQLEITIEKLILTLVKSNGSLINYFPISTNQTTEGYHFGMKINFVRYDSIAKIIQRFNIPDSIDFRVKQRVLNSKT